jgi:hypothetical protein
VAVYVTRESIKRGYVDGWKPCPRKFEPSILSMAQVAEGLVALQEGLISEELIMNNTTVFPKFHYVNTQRV